MNFSTAWLTTNRTCNNNCTWCYAKNTLHSKQIMDFEKAKEAVEELKRRKVKRIVLIGGEPTIYKYFTDLIQFIRDRNILVTVATNGKQFKDLAFAKKVIDAGVSKIDFSIKAFSEEEYFKNTGNYGLEDMIIGYKNLMDLGFNPSLSYVIAENNPYNIDELIRFLENNNFTKICLQFIKPILSIDNSFEAPDLKQMGNLVEEIYNKMKNTKINYSIEISFPLCLIKEEILEKLMKEKRVFNCCHITKGSGINIDETFKILPCNHFAEFPFSEESIDFSDNKSLDALYNTDIVKIFRERVRSYPTIKCQKCNLWNQCGGGCFTYWLTADPNIYIK